MACGFLSDYGLFLCKVCIPSRPVEVCKKSWKSCGFLTALSTRRLPRNSLFSLQVLWNPDIWIQPHTTYSHDKRTWISSPGKIVLFQTSFKSPKFSVELLALWVQKPRQETIYQIIMRGSLVKDHFRPSDHRGNWPMNQAKAVPLGNKLMIILNPVPLFSV